MTNVTTAENDAQATPTDETPTKKGESTVMIGDYTEKFLLERARDLIGDRTSDWEIAKPGAEDRLPRFRRDEIELGNVFGKGGFFVVSEVRKIALKEDGKALDSYSEREETDNESPQDDVHDLQTVVQDRNFMSKHCLRNKSDCRYAFKTMQNICRTDPNTFVNSVVDLVIEMKFLSNVRHPNIIKIRAISEGDLIQGRAFLILDRLYDTLVDRIAQWKKKEQNGFHKLFDFQQKRQNHFLAQRLTVGYDIASALCYLHDLNIIYRDLKPNNVGFDVRGDAKLFDFGLATEFDRDKSKSTAFKLTGDTGTIRYMAPEVAQSQPYTETADVYSFGVLLWEICQMDKPHGKLTDDLVERKVLYCGLRPKIDQQWPNTIRRLLHDCFASNPRRPTMEVVCDVLRREINQLADKKLVDEDVVDSARSAMSARYFN